MAVDSVTYFNASLALFILAYLVLFVDYVVCASCISLSLACGGVYLAAKLIPRGRVNPESRAVFITGCDTGFGHGLACKLDKLGFRVFAGCLVPNGENAHQLKAKSSSNLMVVHCDVTSNTSIKSAKDFVSNHLEGKHELHAVVNNAGIWRWSEIEWAPVEFYRKLADVNIYGMIRVNKAFLPMVRRAKGRIVNVGSIGGLFTNPGNGPYCMTKYAIESYTDALRYEMHKWSVKVVVVEPGHYGHATAIRQYLNDGYADQLWKAMDATTRADYGRAYVDAWNEYFKGSMPLCFPDPSPVVDAMVDAVASRHPKHRYIVGNLKLAYLESYWNSMLPSWLTDRQFNEIESSVATPAAMVKTKPS